MEAKDVAHSLRELSLLLQLSGENPYRARAYDLAASRIEGITDLFERIAKASLEELPGVGPAIAKKIVELVTTGRCESLEALRAAYPPGMMRLLSLPEVGPKKAAALWDLLKIGSVEELEEACNAGRLQALKGFGAKSETKILEGIQRAAQAGNKRLIGDALPIAERMLQHVRALPVVKRAEIAGSIRRFCETISDVDIVASSDSPNGVIQAFAAHPDVAEVKAQGETGCSVMLKSHPPLQADLRVLPDADFATALHHFTGSKGHHVRLRGRALDRGLRISEWGVFRGDEKLPVESEADLYRLLELPAIPPELREDWGEIERAEAGQLPARLLELGDVKGLVHSHSTWSDGRDPLPKMAEKAKALGFEYLTVTEHSEAAAYAGGLDEERLLRQWEEIDALNANLAPFRLLKGLEVDILKTGELDLSERLLAQLEVVIGSIHTRHSMDEDGMTERVLRALDNPHIDILGHPTGRLIHERDPYPLRMDEVLERAALRKVAVEVNGNPQRLDLKSEHVRLALEKGASLVASVDSHGLEELEHLRYAVGTARKGCAQADDVLNTQSLDAFLVTLRLRRATRARS